MNKRLIFLISLFAAALLCQYGMRVSDAQEPASSQVKIRAAGYAGYVRIVLTAEETLVRNASVILTNNKTIKIDFRPVGPADAIGRGTTGISFETAKGVAGNDMPIEIIKSVNLTVKGSSCIITVPNVEDIKVLRLQSPSRIVVDALFAATAKDNISSAKDNTSGAQIKPLTDQIAFKHFVIDAGHGGYDYGIRGANFAEKDFVLVFARELSGILAKGGRDVVLTRKSDQVMSVTERAVMVNKKLPDILISLHVSSTGAPVVYTAPEKPDAGVEPGAAQSAEQKKRETARVVAEAIAKNIEREFHLSVIRESIPLSLLVRSKAPAVLIELPNPDNFSYEKKGRERLLSAIIKGLAAPARDERQPVAAPRPDIRPDNRSENNSGSKPGKI